MATSAGTVAQVNVTVPPFCGVVGDIVAVAEVSAVKYCEGNKYSDTQLLYCKHSKTQTKRFYHGVMSSNDANETKNSDLGLHYLPRLVCLKT